MRCKLKEGYKNGTKRSLYLKYTVKYVDWDSSIVPFIIYLLDATDPWKMSDDSKGFMKLHPCQRDNVLYQFARKNQSHAGLNLAGSDYRLLVVVGQASHLLGKLQEDIVDEAIHDVQTTKHIEVEYYVESCSDAVVNDKCVHTKSASVILPSGGDVIYAVAHQHAGAIGSTLYGQDGRTICSSLPIYGKGKEAGNEAGYVVGMTTCHPRPGSVKIVEGEIITIMSNYSNSQSHTGVMVFFYLAVAEPLEKPNSIMHAQN
ncbi:PREDICTED: uncharacterized protein LOC109186203 [Ipomoea nil]|uniref:uncharacterized protein LOC109186203 n=1 Tax=Ipomoea nil TaxID=35883 RepID=UPI00090165A6|nr:PREDICTED: uncharacterized protein LOC109186203 [Ipomoea nil]